MAFPFLPVHGRLNRERRTVRAMVELHCKDRHDSQDSQDHPAHGATLCPSCEALGHYADHRLEKCPYGDEKPTCVNCPIHCYAREERERMKEVMRYSGPRMLLRHPILALRHMLDGRKVAPPLRPRPAVKGTGD